MEDERQPGITVVATPEEGHNYVEWSGNVQSENAEFVLLMTGDRSIIAHFREDAPGWEYEAHPQSVRGLALDSDFVFSSHGSPTWEDSALAAYNIGTGQIEWINTWAEEEDISVGCLALDDENVYLAISDYDYGTSLSIVL